MEKKHIYFNILGQASKNIKITNKKKMREREKEREREYANKKFYTYCL